MYLVNLLAILSINYYDNADMLNMMAKAQEELLIYYDHI